MRMFCSGLRQRHIPGVEDLPNVKLVKAFGERSREGLRRVRWRSWYFVLYFNGAIRSRCILPVQLNSYAVLSGWHSTVMLLVAAMFPVCYHAAFCYQILEKVHDYKI